jgi:hypothetical protein
MIPSPLEFEVPLLMPPRQHVRVRFVAVCGPGNDGGIVFTIGEA